MAGQQYQAVLAVISDGLSICQVASKVGVSRQTLHAWLATYEAEGLDGLVDRSHRPVSCSHQLPAEVEAPCWSCGAHGRIGARGGWCSNSPKRRVAPSPSESAAYRALVRAAMIDPSVRDRRSRKWKRWERGAPMARTTQSDHDRQYRAIPPQPAC